MSGFADAQGIELPYPFIAKPFAIRELVDVASFLARAEAVARLVIPRNRRRSHPGRDLLRCARNARLALMARWLALVACALIATGVHAETVKIGVFRGTTASGAIYIAKEKGYFAAEGLDPEVVVFDAGEAVAVATMSGAIDIGAAGVSAAFYNLASQGALRIIAGINRDVPDPGGRAGGLEPRL